MKGLKLLALSLGIMTSFCACNNAFSGPLEEYKEEFTDIKASANATKDPDETFKYKQELGKLRSKVLETIWDYQESNISTEQLKKLYRELTKYSTELDTKYMGY